MSPPGFIITYVAPLAFVLLVTMGKEAYDDYLRFLRDREANSARYLILDYTPFSESSPPTSVPPTKAVPSSKLQVGDLVLLEKNQRVPADMILLRTSDSTGTAFVRTDQLDGETDWKLRVAVQSFQGMGDDALLSVKAEVYGQSVELISSFRTGSCTTHNSSNVSTLADPPIKDIHTFVGTITSQPSPLEDDGDLTSAPPAPKVDPLTAENVLWANTVLAAGSAIGFVIYTGPETRAVMNTSHPETKTGLLDLDINRMAKVSRSRV
jgi:phospholipid-translocating ATPase